MINFDQLNDDLSNVKKILKPIVKEIKNAKDDISLDKKNISVAIVQQASLVAYYDEIKSELKHLMDYSEILIKRKKGIIYKEILNNMAKSLTDRALDKLVEADDAYLDVYRQYLDIKELYDKTSGVVSALTQRSYSLNNLVKIYENELQNITVYENA